MTQLDANYGKVLFQLRPSTEVIGRMKELLLNHKELLAALDNPSIKAKEKHAVIDKLFDPEVKNFLKVLCDNNYVSHIGEILIAYDDLVLESKNMIRATLSFVTKPSDAQLTGIKDMICKKYNKEGVLLDLKEDPSLVGGFILNVGDVEYDRSVKGKLLDMQKRLLWR
ncbi:MAG: ATP synthase F1 subunit delta [Candidatus Cellulosilyticum pullistercoris]|uniref:ATP synthase subunit delta n=1 Tax=Candidatus Cellulosilyticum pullistercoris TaxID=2838521 RepID=A0A9E2KCZ8_9FIRM|nr:ATP synthase F1 subunit delta [Candidatus Cellulosilyticum pullistercoris]